MQKGLQEIMAFIMQQTQSACAVGAGPAIPKAREEQGGRAAGVLAAPGAEAPQQADPEAAKSAAEEQAEKQKELDKVAALATERKRQMGLKEAAIAAAQSVADAAAEAAQRDPGNHAKQKAAKDTEAKVAGLRKSSERAAPY